jgi:peptidoglycan/LPS O-acetylase OafA/YrhL
MTIRKFDQIDGLRFFAVFGVVCAHWSWFGTRVCQQISSGSRGVDLFFVISGFLITLGLIRSKAKVQTTGTTLYKFYVRRFLRIFPIYYLTVFILLIFYFDKMSSAIWWYLLYLCNFHSIHIQDWGVGGHFWSLSVEEQFYLVWPFIILLLPNKRLPIAIGSSIILSLAVKSYWYVKDFPFWWGYMHPLASLDALAIGALLSYLYSFYPEQLRKTLYNPWLALLIAVQMVLVIVAGSFPSVAFIYHIGVRTSFGLFSLWLVGRASFGFSGIMASILESPPLRYIGKISYSIYLFHVFIPGMLMGLEFPKNDNLRFLLYGAVTIGLSSISWYLFESRILKYKDRFE